ncbi:hypothetical protein Y032_0139g2136 [Ancylostoma ceylanicum]|uniref:Uncharacterized protein n=1 Tax=Ancylostoma ceylanicum TaxID=53326 RepID=A0A016T4Y3_9BILA|nr:hypothetical protein Y032_0139g2136 [Ancylostoma ceylanicum]
MTGVLCDKNIPDRFKSKVYRAVVQSVALYGAECWPATKEVERRLSDGDEDVTMDGGCHTCRPHPQREDP